MLSYKVDEQKIALDTLRADWAAWGKASEAANTNAFWRRLCKRSCFAMTIAQEICSIDPGFQESSLPALKGQV